MRKTALLIACAGMLVGGMSLAAPQSASAGLNISFGSRGYGYNRGYSNYGYNRGYNNYGYNRGYNNYGYNRGYNNYGHNRGHYDYYPTQVVPHGNHYDVIPGHYHYHNGGHFGGH